MPNHVLTLVCHDRVGIVHAVSGFLTRQRCNIADSQQFGDTDTGRFFMRVHFVAQDRATTLEQLREGFGLVGNEFEMDWQMHDTTVKTRTMLMVSKFGHCLNDLLYRWQIGALQADLQAIVSNHQDFEPLAKAYGMPFHHLPVTKENKPEQEAKLLQLVDDYAIDLIVLARYMQVLSDDLCIKMNGRVINIHHSFLPSFKGAKPHYQAYERGVKLIGATAHYVTADLDEGPIIEQEIARIDHSYGPEKLAAVGRDVEAIALSRAVQWHAEHRVLINGTKTIVFR
jgi:formyltetrahydrofolate deformylase